MDKQTMPVKATPYQHQREAFKFALELFGAEGGDGDEDGKMRDLQEEVQKTAIEDTRT